MLRFLPYGGPMPELPEVETVVTALRQDLGLLEVPMGILSSPLLVSNTKNLPVITKVTPYSEKLRYPIPSLDHLVGKHILSLNRRGKYILIGFEHGTLIIHLGMTGVLHWLNALPAKHHHIDFVISLPQTGDTKTLRYTDPRRFGMVLWEEKGEQHKLLQVMGPEPLDNWHWQDLKDALSNKKIAIKKAIMDNAVVVGVGNIYASEALHRSGINPHELTVFLSDTHIQRLHQSIIFSLQKGIEQKGASIKNYQHIDGSLGQMSNFLLVYGRQQLPCYTCQTPIVSEMIGGRNTFYCPQCQKLSSKTKKYLSQKRKS